MIRELYEEHSRLVDAWFMGCMVGDEMDRIDAVRMHLRRWQAIRDRVYGLRLWVWEVTHDRD